MCTTKDCMMVSAHVLSITAAHMVQSQYSTILIYTYISCCIICEVCITMNQVIFNILHFPRFPDLFRFERSRCKEY